MSASAPKKITNSEVPATIRMGGTTRVLLSPRTVGATDGFLGTLTLERDEFVAEQYHPYSDKFLYLVRGTVTIRIDGAPVDLAADEAVMVRRGARHRIENTGPEQAFLVFSVSPLAPSPEMGHVDVEEPPHPAAPLPKVGAPR